MLKKIISFIKKYFVDIVIQLGIFILTNESIGIKSSLRCTRSGRYTPNSDSITCYSTAAIHSAQLKIFAIMLISIGINIAVRKYFYNKKV